jgi:hypothetical protein
MTDNHYHRDYTSATEDDCNFEAERERLREECSTLFDEKVRSIPRAEWQPGARPLNGR